MRPQPTSLGAVLAAAVLTVTACGGDDDGGASASEGGELTFANWQWLEPGRGDQLWEAVTGYEDVNPDVEMKQQAIARKDYESTLKTQMGAQGGPDIFIIPDTFYPELVEADLLEPVGDALGEEEKAALNQTNEAGVQDGEQLAYAYEVVNYALFWNPKLLDEAGVEPPEDVDGLIEVAKAITEETGNPGFAVRHQMNEEVPWWIDFSNWPYGFGGGWASDGELTIDASENVEAVTAYKEMYDSGAMAVGDDASTFRSKFQEGQIGMMIDNSSALFTMVTDNDVVPSTEVGVSPLPFPMPNTGHASFLIGINKHSNNKELAKGWLNWYFGQEAQEAAADALGASVIGTDAKPPDSFIEENPWVPIFQAQAEHSRNALVEGFESQTPEIRRIVLQEIEKVLAQDEDPQAALERAQEEAAQLVGQ